MTQEEFFKNNPARETSTITGFGASWRDALRTFPLYAVYWIENTGEIYAKNLDDATIEVLGRVQGRADVQNLLHGWQDVCGQSGSMEWIRQRAGNSNMEVDHEIKKTLRDMGELVGKSLPKGWGYTLQLFEFGEGGSLFYVSNAERGAMVEALRELIDRLEQSRPV